MSVSVNYFNKDYNSIPYNFLTKKYFLKRKKNKYKNFKFLRITNVYSNLYQHKIYTLNYYINFLKTLDSNDLNKFGIHQFYFFNFSGLLKQSLIKNVFMYNLLFKECTDNHLILKKDSYYLHKYTLNSLSSFILTKESKNVIQSYNTNYFIKLNNFKNNLLVLNKNEYLKQLNFGNLIILSFGNIDDNYNKNVLNVYYKRWWKALWNINTNKVEISLNKKLFLNLLNIIILKSFLKNNSYIHLLYVCIILKSYLMIPNKNIK